MRGTPRVVLALVAGIAFGFLLGRSPGVVVAIDSLEAIMLGLLGTILLLVIVAGLAAYLITSAEVGRSAMWAGIVILTAGITAAVAIGLRSIIVDGWNDAESWAYVMVAVSIPVVGGVFIGGLIGSVSPSRKRRSSE